MKKSSQNKNDRYQQSALLMLTKMQSVIKNYKVKINIILSYKITGLE